MSFVKRTIFGERSKLKDATPPEFAALRQPLATALSSLLAGGFPQFQGSFTAPISAGETNALSALNSAIGGQGAAGQGNAAAQDLLTQTLQGAFLSPESNPFLRATIEAASRPILQQFDDEFLRQRAQFTGAGQAVTSNASSPFASAEARRQVGLANALGDVGTNLAFSNLANERGLQTQAIQLQQVQQQQEVQNLLSALEANALPRLIEQFGIDQGLTEFQRQQAQLLQLLGIIGNLGSGQSLVLPGTQGALQNFAAGFGEGFGRTTGASDFRLKHDIRKLGYLANGLPLYEFRYAGNNTLQLGIMAHDMEKVYPTALHNLLGYKLVDYNKVL